MDARLGQRAREIRHLRGMEAQDVAEQLGMSRGVYGRLERGENPMSSADSVALARVLRVCLKFLLGNDEDCVADQHELRELMAAGKEERCSDPSCRHAH